MFRLTGNQPRTIDHPRGKTFVLFRQAMANGDEREREHHCVGEPEPLEVGHEFERLEARRPFPGNGRVAERVPHRKQAHPARSALHRTRGRN
jgi:hypothetical protein